MLVVFAALALAGCQAEIASIAKIERPAQAQRAAIANGASARDFVGLETEARTVTRFLLRAITNRK